MTHWIRLTSVADCPPGSVQELVAGDRIVALFNVDGAFHALDGICPHQGGPLGKGTISGAVVTCPWHGWQFNVCTGQHQSNSALRHATLPLKVEAEEVFVKVDSSR